MIIIIIMIITRKPSTPEEIVLVLPLHACVCMYVCTYVYIYSHVCVWCMYDACYHDV